MNNPTAITYLGLSAGAISDPAWTDTQHPEPAYSRAESFEILEVHLKELNPLLRDAVIKTYYDELSLTEASSAVGVPPTTYKARLFRGRRLLQQHATRITRLTSRQTKETDLAIHRSHRTVS